MLILGVSGSLRKGSFNTALLRAAGELAPEGVRVEVVTLADIPPYDDDVRVQQGFPAPAETLRERIRTADAVLLATPEYNYSFSGVIKNAIDWASRPPAQPFAGKAVAVVSASPGLTGGIRAQWALKPVVAALRARVLFQPEVAVGGAREKFDGEGKLVDPETRERLAALLRELVALARG